MVMQLFHHLVGVNVVPFVAEATTIPSHCWCCPIMLLVLLFCHIANNVVPPSHYWCYFVMLLLFICIVNDLVTLLLLLLILFRCVAGAIDVPSHCWLLHCATKYGSTITIPPMLLLLFNLHC